MKIVLVTGISGSDVGAYTRECVAEGNARQNGAWHYTHFSDLMYEADSERSRLNPEQWEEGILKRGAALPHLRNAAFDKLLEKVFRIRDREPLGENHFLLISTKATFWYRKTLLPGLDPSRLNELDPDCFVTIVDDVLDIWARLLSTGQSRWTELSPVDILEWREIETFFTEQMAHSSGQRHNPKPFFVLARRYPAETLIRILTEPSLKRYYRSYPITFVNQRPEVRREADELAARLEKKAILFDPMGILDWDHKDQLRERYEDWCKENGYSESSASWDEIEKHLRHQTVSRDHRLIDQSHGVVVFYPELEYYTSTDTGFDLTPLVPFSSGVLDEMQYATQRGKEVFLVWTSQKDPGPFLPTIFTSCYGSCNELIDFLQ